MTHPLAAQRCADLATDVSIERGRDTKWDPKAFLESSGVSSDQLAFRRYVEAVNEAVQQCHEDVVFASLNEQNKFDRLLGQFLLREPVDPVLESMREALPRSQAEAAAVAITKNLRTELAHRGLHITEIGRAEQ